ncbi:MAG: VTT domain-containing protein [Candidatus Woesearchaeota archaeon]|jgi:membrane protein YqaA with SNARE-associated domain|nr:VTT domain-containing protein [Candidatus Woesearchaeota archaeon]
MKKRLLKLKLILSTFTVILLSLALMNNLVSGDETNLLTFSIVNFLSYLFFLLLPAEGFFIYYLTQNNNHTSILIVTISTAIIAQISDYALGYLAAENIAVMIKKERYNRYRNWMIKYGYYAIFFFNLMPLSSPIVVLISGIMKLRLRRVIIVSFCGLTLKYSIIVIFYNLII